MPSTVREEKNDLHPGDIEGSAEGFIGPGLPLRLEIPHELNGSRFVSRIGQYQTVLEGPHLVIERNDVEVGVRGELVDDSN